MQRVSDVARFLVQACEQEKNRNFAMTNLRVNKLLFFIQGQYMAQNGEPMFDAEFEAWDFGPVVSEVYQQYKVFADNQIIDQTPLEASFSAHDYEAIFDVLDATRNIPTGSIVEMTHIKGSPWFDVYHHVGRGAIIPQNAIEKYFQNHKFKEGYLEGIDKLRARAFTPQRDENGIPILPKEFWEE